MTITAELAVRLLRALDVQHRGTVRELLVLAVVHQLPQLAAEDITDVLGAFPARVDGQEASA